MLFKIFCIIPDGNETKTVEDLKDAVKKKQHPNLKNCPAAALKLYRVDIDGSDMRKAITDASNLLSALDASNFPSETPLLLSPLAQLIC